MNRTTASEKGGGEVEGIDRQQGGGDTRGEAATSQMMGKKGRSKWKGKPGRVIQLLQRAQDTAETEKETM
jgi:hypothetical protein